MIVAIIVDIGTVITTMIIVFNNALVNSLFLNNVNQFSPLLKLNPRFKFPLSLGAVKDKIMTIIKGI